MRSPGHSIIGIAVLVASTALSRPALACDPTSIDCSLENFDDPFGNPDRAEIYDGVGYGLLGNAAFGALLRATQSLPSDPYAAPNQGSRRHGYRRRRFGMGAR